MKEINRKVFSKIYKVLAYKKNRRLAVLLHNEWQNKCDHTETTDILIDNACYQNFIQQWNIPRLSNQYEQKVDSNESPLIKIHKTRKTNKSSSPSTKSTKSCSTSIKISILITEAVKVQLATSVNDISSLHLLRHTNQTEDHNDLIEHSVSITQRDIKRSQAEPSIMDHKKKSRTNENNRVGMPMFEAIEPSIFNVSDSLTGASTIAMSSFMADMKLANNQHASMIQMCTQQVKVLKIIVVNAVDKRKAMLSNNSILYDRNDEYNNMNEKLISENCVLKARNTVMTQNYNKTTTNQKKCLTYRAS